MSDLLGALFGHSIVHGAFDIAAWAASMASLWLVSTRLLPPEALSVARLERPALYAVVAAGGVVAGAMVIGTANVRLSGLDVIGFSVIGGFAGGIAAIEIYKPLAGIRGSTGIVFAAPLAVSVIVGRWGCFFAGLPDFTYGTATTLPWGVDFGDGVPRHPVQLYESAAMALFLVVFLWRLTEGDPFWIRNGFFLAVAWYALQRFGWEYLKPYATLAGPFNLFHFVCLALFGYATLMMRRVPVAGFRAKGVSDA